MSSSTFLTASWLSIFVSAKPGRTILSIDRSEPRFENYTGGKTRKTLQNDGNFDVSRFEIMTHNSYFTILVEVFTNHILAKNISQITLS